MTGEVVESFSPDFYLPDLDLYVELTTLKQKLVRKKNRKLRRLRELYPDVRIKLFYARDFRALLLKFGRLALLDDLYGHHRAGHAPRTADRIVAEAGAAAGLGGPASSAAADGALDQATPAPVVSHALPSRSSGRRPHPAVVVAAAAAAVARVTG